MHRDDETSFNPYVARPYGAHRAHHHPHGHAHPHGHNQGTAQWQTPHVEGGPDAPQHHHHEPDLDLVEKAFVEGFQAASDPTSFLRLAGIPFSGRAADGTSLKLLRVAVDLVADVASLTPHIGGESFRHDPLPAAMVSKRETLRFVYFDGMGPVSLSFEDARNLIAE
ncbi:hypothetical protein [Acuticoccus yangtzensis]|uniref:hypothetical protein n=1 Tax=Acuticoccus yangtzensis TaxID=1443441 RepID=UPI00094984EF